MKSVLTETQLRNLKEHKYSCQGISIVEQYLQPIWRELVEKLPLWVAPNLITFTGLMVNLVSTAFIVVQDPNGEGKATMWAYLFAAFGLLVYQTLDALDGKQARRTGSANPLGELFDHGCDAVSTYLVALCGVSSIGMASFPMMAVFFVVLLLELNFCYHWQTYVCGKLYFYSVDVTEGQYTSMAVFIIAGLYGVDAWDYMLPILGISFRVGIIIGTIFFSLLNYINVFKVILSRGAGKNGSTVADTSVVSPFITPLILVPMVFIYASMSPGYVIQNHLMLFLCALTLPIVKTTILMMLAGMTKSPFPLVDPIMLGPFLAICNLYLGELVPEYYALWLLALFNSASIVYLCVSVCIAICEYLQVSCFTILYPPPGTKPQQDGH